MAGRVAYYGGIVTNGLTLNLDSAKQDSYPRSGSIWRDISIENRSSTLTNGPVFSEDNGGIFIFDGSNDYVNGPGISSLLTGDITVEAWIRISSGPSDWVRVIGTGSNPSGNRTFGLWYSATRTLLWQRLGTNSFSLSAANVLNYNTWYYIAGTSIGTSHVLYLNGSSIGTTTVTGPWAASNENITLGAAVGVHTYLTGNIAIGRIYTRGLLAAEILQNYNATKTRFGQ